jgi:argininosuccinate lyase
MLKGVHFMSSNSTKKPWGGRFKEQTAPIVERFTSSVEFDNRLYRHDIQGSIAHARMLARAGILKESEMNAILQGLTSILHDIGQNNFEWKQSLEDVHMNIERELANRIGEPGKRLHTARSRNDQVATDVRMYLRDEIDRISALLTDMQRSLYHQAERYPNLIMPGYTHLQPAQPVLWGHHMLAYYEMFKRDRERLADVRKRVNILPLGSAALAGTGFPIDRHFVAEQLGFEAVSRNSMDAVSDRDFIVEFLGAASLIMVHLSRLSEDIILWNSSEFGFVELPDGFCTGSSIMPQKKNPDVCELTRGKSGRVFGHLMAMLTILKGLPMTYNRDLQEDKEALFDAIDTVTISLAVMAAMVEHMRPRPEHIQQSLPRGLLTATDLADYLTRKGLPFREAHEVVGRIVAWCIENKKDLAEMTLTDLKTHHPLIEEDIFPLLTYAGSVASRTSYGGTAQQNLLDMLKTIACELEKS